MYGWRARIGYTSPPAATEVFPYEFYKIVPAGVTLVLHTLPIVDRSSDEVDRSYDYSLHIAKAMARAGVSIFVFGGLPINFSRGVADAADLADRVEGELGIPVLTAAAAQQDALAALGARKVGIIQPYGDEHGPRHMEYVRQFGCEPTGWVSLNTAFHEQGRISLTQVQEAARRLKTERPETDTIHIYSPHYATAGVTAALEQELGINILASLQAIVWRALRRVGIDDRIAGFGRLLADH